MRNLRLLEDVLVSADLHADEIELLWVFPAATHLAILFGKEFLDGLDVV